MTRHIPLFKTGVVVVVLAGWLSAENQVTGPPVAPNERARSNSRQQLLTRWGHPDLQGIWTNTTTTPLERPDDLKDKPFLSDEEYAKRNAQRKAEISLERDSAQHDPGAAPYNDFWQERGKLHRRTSLVIDPPDGKVPALTEAARARAEALAVTRARPAQSHEDRSAYDRCITRGLPGAMMPGFYNHNYHIVQTPTHVAIMIEMIHDVRIIPLDGRPHIGGNVRLWLGDSRGRWEGNTLVVETTNFNDKVFEPHTAVVIFSTGRNLRLVERFTRLDVNTMDYEFTVDDSSVYTRPWTVALPMIRIPGPILEYACHEGNQAMLGMLQGARARDKASR